RTIRNDLLERIRPGVNGKGGLPHVCWIADVVNIKAGINRGISVIAANEETFAAGDSFREVAVVRNTAAQIEKIRSERPCDQFQLRQRKQSVAFYREVVNKATSVEILQNRPTVHIDHGNLTRAQSNESDPAGSTHGFSARHERNLMRDARTGRIGNVHDSKAGGAVCHGDERSRA